MSWNHVLRRDFVSLSRSRILSSVLSFIILLSVLPLWIIYPPRALDTLRAIFILVFVGVMLGLALFKRPRLVAATAVLATAVFIAAGLGSGSEFSTGSRDTVDLIHMISIAFSILIPLFALLGTYGALVGERTTGSIRFLLGLPNSRFDAYVGKLLSRTSLVLCSVFLAIGLVSVALLSTAGVSAFFRMLGVGLITVPYVVTFIGIGLTASAIAETDTHAVAISIGTYVAFRLGWPSVQFLLIDHTPGYPKYTPLYFWVGRINPLNAYGKSFDVLLPYSEINTPLVTTTSSTVAPIAQSTEFAVVVLILWAVLTPTLGFIAFRNRDLL